jgi:hypothetical protein
MAYFNSHDCIYSRVAIANVVAITQNFNFNDKFISIDLPR